MEQQGFLKKHGFPKIFAVFSALAVAIGTAFSDAIADRVVELVMGPQTKTEQPSTPTVRYYLDEFHAELGQQHRLVLKTEPRGMLEQVDCQWSVTPSDLIRLEKINGQQSSCRIGLITPDTPIPQPRNFDIEAVVTDSDGNKRYAYGSVFLNNALKPVVHKSGDRVAMDTSIVVKTFYPDSQRSLSKQLSCNWQGVPAGILAFEPLSTNSCDVKVKYQPKSRLGLEPGTPHFQAFIEGLHKQLGGKLILNANIKHRGAFVGSISEELEFSY